MSYVMLKYFSPFLFGIRNTFVTIFSCLENAENEINFIMALSSFVLLSIGSILFMNHILKAVVQQQSDCSFLGSDLCNYWCYQCSCCSVLHTEYIIREWLWPLIILTGVMVLTYILPYLVTLLPACFSSPA